MDRGNYYGTEIDGRWWQRYRSTGFFARGNGRFWMDERGLHFHKALAGAPLTILWDEISAVWLGTWHCGRWGLGRPLLKVGFARDGRNLTAGFQLSGDRQGMDQLVGDITARLSRR